VRVRGAIVPGGVPNRAQARAAVVTPLDAHGTQPRLLAPLLDGHLGVLAAAVRAGVEPYPGRLVRTPSEVGRVRERRLASRGMADCRCAGPTSARPARSRMNISDTNVFDVEELEASTSLPNVEGHVADEREHETRDSHGTARSRTRTTV
jgi:hypothetical protein